MKSYIYFVLLVLITTFNVLGQSTSGLPAPSVASGGAVAQSCVGNPGNTIGKYQSQCQASTGAVYACNNSAGCSVAADWVAGGNVTGSGSSVNGDLACFNGVTGALLSDCGILPSTLAPLASPTFTGTPSAPTATAGTNSTQLATTAFVQTAIGGSGTITGVTAGTGLSGGGTSGNVSVALSTPVSIANGGCNATTAAGCAANLNAVTTTNTATQILTAALTAPIFGTTRSADGYAGGTITSGWSNATAYTEPSGAAGSCQAVIYNGHSYVAMVANTNAQPDTNPNIWYNSDNMSLSFPPTKADCAFADAYGITITTLTNTLLTFGPVNYQKVMDWKLPSISNSQASLSLKGAGRNETVLISNVGSNNPSISQASNGTGAIQQEVMNMEINANGLSKGCLNVQGTRASQYSYLYCYNVAPGTFAGIQVGAVNGAGTNVGAYELLMDYDKVADPNVSGYSPPVFNCTGTGTITCALTSGGSNVPTTAKVSLYGYTHGAFPCTVMPTSYALTVSGGTASALTFSGESGCTAPGSGTYDVQIYPASNAQYGFYLYGMTDSTVREATVSNTGSVAAIFTRAGFNSWFHPHWYSYQPIGMTIFGATGVVDPECDSSGQYCLDIEGNDVSIQGFSRYWNSTSAYPGTSDIYFGTGVTSGIDIEGMECSRSTNSNADYHQFVNASGVLDGSASLGLGIKIGGNTACEIGQTAIDYVVNQTSFQNLVTLNDASGYGGDLLDANLNGVNQFAVLNGGGINVGPNSNTATNIILAGSRAFLKYDGTNASVGGGTSRGAVIYSNNAIGGLLDVNSCLGVGSSSSACTADKIYFDANGLTHLNGTAPTASSGTVTGSNNGGYISGLSAATSVTLTFANSGFTTWAACTGMPSVSLATPVYVSAQSATACTFTMPALTGTLYYHVDGK